MRNKLLALIVLTLVLLGVKQPIFAADSLPNAPTGVTAESSSAVDAIVDSASVTVGWTRSETDTTHPSPIGYLVKAISGVDVYQLSVARVGNQDKYSAVLSGLKGGTTYSVTVSARGTDANNTLVASSIVSVTAKTAPDAPTDAVATAGVGSVALKWSAPTNNGGDAITQYIIKDASNAETVISNFTTLAKTFDGLTSGSTAKYSIRAKNSVGKSAWVAFNEVTLPTAPGQPTSVTAIASGQSLSISWLAPTNTGNSPITGYKVYLFNDSNVQVGSAKSVTTLSTTIDSLTASTTYTVKVKASNLVGDSEYSTASSPQTTAAPTVLTPNVPIFTPSTLPNLVIGGSQSFNVSAPSGDSVTVTATGTPLGACTYAGGVVSAIAEGTCTIRATVSSNSTYAEGAATKTFSITKTLQTITFSAIGNQPMPGPLVVSASSTSGLTVTFTASNDNCTVSGTTVSFVSMGICTVTASQAGSSTFASATPVSRTFTITAASNSSNNSSNNSGGGYFGGGGAFVPPPAPMPSISPSASPSPSVSVTALPTATPTPSVMPSASPLPTPSASPTVVAPKPSVTPSASSSAIVTKTNSFAVATSSTKVTGPVNTSTLKSATSAVAIKSASNFQAVLPTVKKGEQITMVIKDATGNSFKVAAITATKSGSLKLPAVKFAKVGTYTITIKIGTTTKTVKVISIK